MMFSRCSPLSFRLRVRNKITRNGPLTLTLSPVIGGEGIHFITRSYLFFLCVPLKYPSSGY